MSTERSISLGRRALIRSLFATPALVASASAARRTVSPGVDWGKWFHDWFGRDFGMIGYYSDDNARLLASREPVDIVFLGDSITEGWRDARPAFFQRGRINRGISGQTTPQMLLRMYSDVVALLQPGDPGDVAAAAALAADPRRSISWPERMTSPATLAR